MLGLAPTAASQPAPTAALTAPTAPERASSVPVLPCTTPSTVAVCSEAERAQLPLLEPVKCSTTTEAESASTANLEGDLHLLSTPLPPTAVAGHFLDSGGVSTSSSHLGATHAQMEASSAGTPGRAPPVKGKANGSRIAAWIRSRVSQNKVRYRDDSFNLDLTYITNRIIAMGYPAHGTEYYIRNPIDKVEDFLDERHRQHFRVYNLCSERTYDTAARFHGQFKRFPFDDHNAPSLQLMCDFVADAVSFLSAHEQNVVAVHCKAGKGRTGIMVCCLLWRLFPEKFGNVRGAITHFNSKRTNDGAGLTIPSQQRYVEYYGLILRDLNGIPPAVNRVAMLREIVIGAGALQQPLQNPSDLYFVVHERDTLKLDSRTLFPRGPRVSEVGMVFSFSAPFPSLEGDVKVTVFRRRPMVLSGKESAGFYVWLNTNFDCDKVLVLQRSQLDKLDDAAFTSTTTVGIRFEAPSVSS